MLKRTRKISFVLWLHKKTAERNAARPTQEQTAAKDRNPLNQFNTGAGMSLEIEIATF